jgi:serine-type D-Ala-D-Ala carboxypeptidase/endopeptidase (penicillin-binding protein 4)
MEHFMKLAAFVLVLFSSLPIHAATEASLRKIVTSYKIPQERLGLFAVDLAKPNHPVLLTINGEKNFIPASTTKVITATAILQKFGPSYKFQTDLLMDGTVEGETLKGALYLRGGGDPGFVSETMWVLVNEFYRSGIREVGDIVVDESLFDDVRFDASRDPERNDRAYDAPIGAMSFNWNSINVFVRPSEPGQPPHVFLDPEMEGWKVSNRAKTTKSGEVDVRVSRSDGEMIFVDGKIPATLNEKVVYKNVPDPVQWSGQGLKAFLLQRGIHVKGKVRAGTTPANAKLVAHADSKPLSQIVGDMMKFSNNFVAEMLTKDLAAKFAKTPAHLEDGVKVIRDTLIEMGLKADRFSFVNPSGFSRKNNIKPADLAFLLSENYKRFSYEPEYLAAMPLAGIDGTLKSRFKNSNAIGWVRAKTGHLNGVVGLAGFAGQKDGGATAFVFIFNGPADQGDLASRLFDALASELVQ